MNLVLFDGNNLAFRVGHVHRFLKTTSGLVSGCFYGVISAMLGVKRLVPDSNFVFVWDGIGTNKTRQSTWRHKLSNNSYKGNRSRDDLSAEAKAVFESVQEQIPTIQKFISLVGIKQIGMVGVEADDVIGMLATKAINQRWYDRAVITSGDKDFFQLVREQLYVLRSWNKKSVFVTSQTIEEEFGIPSVSWAQLRALTGDDSDTIIKAKKGVGPKTAAKLLIGGLNPANPRFEDHNQKVVAKFSEAWKNLWPQVHQNYLLSKILTYENFSSNGFLDIETRAKVESLAKAQKSDLLGKRDEDNWDVMEEFLIRYEMHDFWESRREIWRLNETSTP